ncbi:hypothetical protein MMC14_003125 [Varicellaria rhodocarpa]|nr:hypothetical protein [Varicellaria rhodocarpa]
MPIPASLQLSVELTKLLPLQTAVNSAAASVLKLARELKRSGSDILIEADLASIFGRARLESNFEQLFKERISKSSIASLHKDSEIMLDARPGPTIRRALQEQYYLSTVAQLSLLGWFHERKSLAASLVECMNKRARIVPDATMDATYEGVLRFLEICDAETSMFPWELYVGLIEAKLPETTIVCHGNHEAPWKKLSPYTLTAAMDFLYLVQSLPKDRIMVVQDHTGLVPLLIWAHYVLGLSVLAKQTPDGDIHFGEVPSMRAEVVIIWDTQGSKLLSNQVCLLDSSDQVIIDPLPKDYFPRSLRIDAQERTRLGGIGSEECGFGTLELRRTFNSCMTIQDNHPMYKDFAETITALAISVSQFLYHEPFLVDSQTQNSQFISLCFENLEHWRIHDASEIIFRGIGMKKESISQTLEELREIPFDDTPLPQSVQNYVKRVKVSKRYPTQFHIDFYIPRRIKALLMPLVILVLTFSHVTNVKRCSELPLAFDCGVYMDEFRNKFVHWNGRDPIPIKDDDWLVQLAIMLVGKTFMDLPQTIRQRFSVLSDFGWSIVLSNVGDDDPSQVQPSLLSVQKGVPTSTLTQVRKNRVLDTLNVIGGTVGSVKVEQKKHYKPCCISKVTDRNDHYASRDQEFWHTMSFLVENPALAPNVPLAYRQLTLSASYRQLQRVLFKIVRPSPCPHWRDPPLETAKLTPQIATVRGFSWSVPEPAETEGHRICIVLVKGSRWARWLAIAGIRGDGDPTTFKPQRQVMLRGDDCCEDCAVNMAADLPGKWVVII